MNGRRFLITGCRVAAGILLVAACGGSPESEREPKVAATTTKKGRTLYGEYGCAACHGPEGGGNGPLARSLPVKPRDLNSSTAYRNGSDAASVAKTIAEGLMTKGLGMPPYPHIPESERREIAEYLVSLQRR